QIQGAVTKKKSSIQKMAEEAPLAILKQFDLAGAVIDEETTIHHIVGDLSQYIAIPSGLPDFRLSNLLSRDANLELTIFIRKTEKENRTLKSRKYPLGTDEKKRFSFSLKHLEKDEVTQKDYFLVTFESSKVIESGPASVSGDQASVTRL